MPLVTQESLQDVMHVFKFSISIFHRHLHKLIGSNVCVYLSLILYNLIQPRQTEDHRLCTCLKTQHHTHSPRRVKLWQITLNKCVLANRSPCLHLKYKKWVCAYCFGSFCRCHFLKWILLLPKCLKYAPLKGTNLSQWPINSGHRLSTILNYVEKKLKIVLLLKVFINLHET